MSLKLTKQAFEQIIANFGNEDEGSDDSSASGGDYTDKEDSDLVAKAKKEAQSEGEYTFTERDGELFPLFLPLLLDGLS